MIKQNIELSTINNTNVELAVVYLRVSTEDQNKKGFSIDSQRKMALAYKDNYNEKIKKELLVKKPIFIPENLIIKEVKPASQVFKEYTDEDLFASLNSRPVLKNILEMAQRREFKHLIVYSRDRLSRNFEQFIALKYLLKKNSIQIHYSRPGENLDVEDTKINRFLDNILASVAELEANTIGIRVRSGSEQCVKRGNWPGGTPPYGYILKTEKVSGKKHHISKLKPSTYEKIKVLDIFQLYSKGHGYRSIAKILNKKYDEDIWTKSKIEKIIKNETYTGKIVWNRRGGRRYPGKKGAPIYSSEMDELKFIDLEYWNESVKLREKKTSLKDSKYYNTSYLLKGKLVCGNCGQKLKTKNYGKGLLVYRCPTKLENKSELVLHKTETENLIMNKINSYLNHYDSSLIWESYLLKKEKQIKEKELLIENLKPDIKNIQRLQHNLKALIDNLNFSDKKFEVAFRDRLNAEDLKLTKVKIQHKEKVKEYEDFINNSFFSSKDEYLNHLKNFKIDINTLSHRDQRLFIDILIDEILINKNNKDLDINIIFNPPRPSLYAKF